MTDTTIVKLGMAISEFNYDEEGQKLYISGPALEEGTWTGMNGIPTFFPRSVIHDGSHFFEGCDIVCEHSGLSIGKVTSVHNTEMGFSIQGYLTNTTSIDAVLSARKNGFSIEAAIVIDPVRRIAERIVKAMNISLVETPACRVCSINAAKLDKSTGNISMSENNEANTSPDTNAVQTTGEDKKTGAFKELTAAAEAFKSAKAKLDKILLGFGGEPEVTPEATPTEPIPKGTIVPVSEVVEQTTETDVEVTVTPMDVPSEAVTEETPTADPEVAPATEPEVTDPVIDDIPEDDPTASPDDDPDQDGSTEPEPATTDDITEVKTALSAAANTITAVTDKLVELTNAVQTMEIKLGQAKTEASTYKEKAEGLEAELKKIETNERDTILAEINELDPEVSSEFLAGMTVAQLSAYKANVQRIVANIPLADKKSVKKDESVELSAPKSSNEVDFTDTVSRKKFIEQSLYVQK